MELLILRPLLPAQLRMDESGRAHWVVTGAPRSGKSTALVERVRGHWTAGMSGDRMLLLTPDRRSARRLTALVGAPPANAFGRVAVMSYHSFAQDLIRRWWPLVMERHGIQASTPEFLPFNLAQFACLNEYRADPGNLQRLTIREQRLIVQVLSNMNLSAGNGLTLDDGWERVAFGLGVPASDPVIQDGLRLTQRFRECCLRAGVMPVDLQVEAAGRLLDLPEVRGDLLARYDLLALDDLDEFVPLMAERLTSLASECRQAVVTCCDDGGLRWLLGASVERSRRICEALVKSGAFEHAHLGESHSRSPALLSGSAAWLARAVAGETSVAAGDASGWRLREATHPDKMAAQVVEDVSRMVASGISPKDIVLLIPYLDTLIATSLERLFAQRDIPFAVDRHWQSLLDDRASRACLTALRCVNPTGGRKATPVEVADLLETLTGFNPIAVQPWVDWVFDKSTGTLRRPQDFRDVPREVRLLGLWGERARNMGELHWQLEMLASRVFAPHQSREREDLVRACYALANEARRFAGTAPRFGMGDDHGRHFFDYVDSNVVAADSGAEPQTNGVMLTTPYAFLISGRTAIHQCWLDVASPSWWEPPLLLLSNPHAMHLAPGGLPLTIDDDDRIRGEILGRIIRNLASRCDGSIHTFASFYASDGGQLDGPLYEALLGMQAAPA